MKTPAIIASLTVAGSIAYATSRVQDAPGNLVQGPYGVGCPMVAAAPLPWFGQVRELPRCMEDILATTSSSWPEVSLMRADVNEDGTTEFFYKKDYFSHTTSEVGPSQTDTTFPVLCVLQFDPFNPSAGVSRAPIITVGTFREWVNSQPETCTSVTTRFGGWGDFDGDHDLDAVFGLDCTSNSSSRSALVWIENIGYEKPAPPIAADLDGDGQVNGADLGLLLVAWGPNP